MPLIAHSDDQGNIGVTGNSDANNDPRNIGFGPAWRRYLRTGIYNSDFAVPCSDLSSDLDSVNNPLPYWAGPVVVGTSCTAQLVAVSTTGSGYELQMDLGPGADGDLIYMEQWVPVTGSADRSMAYYVTTFCDTSYGWNDGAGRRYESIQFFKSDGVTTTGTEIVKNNNTGFTGNDTTVTSAYSSVPADAYWARLRFGIMRVAAGTTTDTMSVRFTEVVFGSGYQYIIIPDARTPASYRPAWIEQDSGELLLMPTGGYDTGAKTSLMGGTSFAKITWDGTQLVSTTTTGSTTPTINNGGTATFSGQTCTWFTVGMFVFCSVTFSVTANGSGASTVTITGTSAPAVANTHRAIGDRGGVGVNVVFGRVATTGGAMYISAMYLAATPTTALTGADLVNGATYTFNWCYLKS